MHPTSVFYTKPELVLTEPTDPLPTMTTDGGSQLVHATVKNPELLCFLQILETTRPYLVNVFRLPCLAILLLAKRILVSRDLMKIVVDAQSDLVLGVHIVGPDSGEMAQLLGISLKMGAKKSDFDRTMAVHPTAAEELVTMYSPSYQVIDGIRTN